VVPDFINADHIPYDTEINASPHIVDYPQPRPLQNGKIKISPSPAVAAPIVSMVKNEDT
jgi:hypothetical protein